MKKKDIAARTGFSLVEMMIVVSVVGILMTIATPSLLKARADTARNEALGELEILAAAVQQLAWDTGVWPGGEPRNAVGNRESWDLEAGQAGLVTADSRFLDWNGPYIGNIPLDPWGNPYFFDPDYRIDNRNRVVVGSFGPNGKGRNIYDADNIYVILQ